MAMEEMPAEGAPAEGGDPAAQLGQIVAKTMEGMNVIGEALGANPNVPAQLKERLAGVQQEFGALVAEIAGGAPQGQPQATGPGSMEAGGRGQAMPGGPQSRM